MRFSEVNVCQIGYKNFKYPMCSKEYDNKHTMDRIPHTMDRITHTMDRIPYTIYIHIDTMENISKRTLWSLNISKNCQNPTITQVEVSHNYQS